MVSLVLNSISVTWQELYQGLSKKKKKKEVFFFFFKENMKKEINDKIKTKYFFKYRNFSGKSLIFTV